MPGELRVAIGVHDLSSPILTTKHAIDASTTRQGDLTVELRSDTGEPILFDGKKVYISDRGARKLSDWRRNDRLDSLEMKVYKESMLGNLKDAFWGLHEED